MEAASRQPDPTPLLILGAGINGAALSRELVLNGVPVYVVDTNDIAFGASSKSTRLIHGGLRYLEYGDFGLVKESLRERARLRRLAPQFVRPLRLHVPVRKRFAGLWTAPLRFLGLSRFRIFDRLLQRPGGGAERGLWVVRIGLWLYDRLAKGREFPPHSVERVTAESSPQVDSARYRWMCAYTDGQMLYPERFIVALFEDARRLAEEGGVEFQMQTYSGVEFREKTAIVRSSVTGAVVDEFQPEAVVNATGAWGDWTLEGLQIPAPRMFGGTKGSHLVTYNAILRQAIGDDGIYAEAEDGRLVFVLPFGEGVLIGTTDERFEERPERAVASAEEIDYLIQMTNGLFPHVKLAREEVELHYSGVRPLPRITGSQPGAVSRDHAIHEHHSAPFPMLTLIGGKLTTARAFAEEVADVLFDRLNLQRTKDSRMRPVPGGENYPESADALQTEWERLAQVFSLPVEQLRAVWRLCGTLTESILREIGTVSPETLHGTDLPVGFVRRVIEREWVATLPDLVERRLMLLYQPGLPRAALESLADWLIAAGKLAAEEKGQAVQGTIDRLKKCYGKRVKE